MTVPFHQIREWSIQRWALLIKPRSKQLRRVELLHKSASGFNFCRQLLADCVVDNPSITSWFTKKCNRSLSLSLSLSRHIWVYLTIRLYTNVHFYNPNTDSFQYFNLSLKSHDGLVLWKEEAQSIILLIITACWLDKQDDNLQMRCFLAEPSLSLINALIIQIGLMAQRSRHTQPRLLL